MRLPFGLPSHLSSLLPFKKKNNKKQQEHWKQLHCSLPQHNSLSMHINMHYTPSTTHPTASNVLRTQLTQGTASWQNGTRRRDGVKVLCCHSHLVWLVFEGSIPTCACFCSENFLWLYTVECIITRAFKIDVSTYIGLKSSCYGTFTKVT